MLLKPMQGGSLMLLKPMQGGSLKPVKPMQAVWPEPRHQPDDLMRKRKGPELQPQASKALSYYWDSYVFT